MTKLLSIVSIALCLVVYQANATESEAKTKFLRGEIAPDVLGEVPDLKTLKVSYPTGVKVDLGNVLTPTQVKDQPDVEWEAEKDAFYTLLMTDPDAPSRKEPTRREFRHWLTVNIEGSDLSTGESIFQYIGSGPPKDTGLHRYVFILFKQPNGKIEFDSPYVSDHSPLGRPSTSTRDLMKKYNLIPVAGNFYEAEFDDYVPLLHAQLAGKSAN